MPISTARWSARWTRCWTGNPGIVWVLTNNKNSRNNSPQIDRNTRDFAELVRSSPYLPFVAAYPVRMPVTGRLVSPSAG